MQTKRRAAPAQDLFTSQRAAAALDQMQVLGRLVRAVDVEIDFRDVAEPVDGIPSASSLRVERSELDTTAREAGGVRGKRVDEEIHRAPGADAEHDAVLDVRERGERGAAFAVLTQTGPPKKESARNEAGTTLV